MKGEEHQHALLRSAVLYLLVSCKDPQAFQEAKSQFGSHAAKVTQIHPDLRAAIYSAVASDCDKKTFELFFQLYRETDLHEEKNRIARAMGATKDQSRMQKVIDFSMSVSVFGFFCFFNFVKPKYFSSFQFYSTQDEVKSQDAVFVWQRCQ